MSYLSKPQTQSPGGFRPKRGPIAVGQEPPPMEPLAEPHQPIGSRFDRDRDAGTLPKSASQVESAVIRLASLVSSLHSALDRLNDRVTPALRTEPNASCEGREAGSNVPLAADLLEIGDRVETAIAQIRSMEERIEL